MERLAPIRRRRVAAAFAAVVSCIGLAAAVHAQGPTVPAVRSTTEAGVFTSYYANGAVRERGPLAAGDTRTGEWQVFWPNGRLAGCGAYVRGERDGEWRWHDCYGRLAETQWYGARREPARVYAPCERVPLRVEDLRCGLVGTTTVGEWIDRWRAAGDGRTGDAIRREAAGALAAAPEEAVHLPLAIAEGLPPGERTRWLRLAAAMPLPQRLDVGPLLAWCDDPECGAAATAVLTAWSSRFAEEWQPLLASSGRTLYVDLPKLGPRAFAALPELRRGLRDGSLPGGMGWSLVAIRGLDENAPLDRWLAALDDPDRGRVAEAAQILAALVAGPRGRARTSRAREVPAATIVRLFDDECPAVLAAATSLLHSRSSVDVEAFDEWLVPLAHHATSYGRLFAASRLAALGRSDEAETVWWDVATHEPLAMGSFRSWSLFVRHTSRRAELRELLLREFGRGTAYLLDEVARIAGDDPRGLDAFTDQGRRHAYREVPKLPPAVLRALRERLLAAFLDLATPMQDRSTLLANLAFLAEDRDARRELIARGLRDGEPVVRETAVRLWSPDSSTSSATWRALLEDPATRSVAAAKLSEHPFPDDLDPRPYTTDPGVLATWAEDDPERIALLVDAAAAQHKESIEALLLLQPDLRSVQTRFGPVSQYAPVPQWWQQNRDVLRRMMPEAAAEWRIVAALPPLSRGCGAGHVPGRRTSLVLPADAAMLAAIERRLPLGPISRGHALEMLMLLGPEARPLLAAFEKALPTFRPAELARVPDVICSIAPDAAARVCEPLLAHPVAEVAAAALLGPRRASYELGREAIRVPGGAAFAKRIVEHLVRAGDGAAGTVWFTVLEEAVDALPELRTALRDHPENGVIVNVVADLGPAAAAAVPELLLAFPRQPFSCVRALEAVLPVGTRFPHLLPLLESGHLVPIAPLLEAEPVDGAALLALENAAMHGEGALRQAARRLLARSVSLSPIADEVRRALLVEEPAALAASPGHLARLWPLLTEAERRRAVAVLANGAGQPLPAELVEVLAARLDPPAQDEVLVARLDPPAPDAGALWALMNVAPLHPRVLERIDASNRSWNLTAEPAQPSQQPASRWFEMHTQFLVRSWLRGDARLRATVLPHLRRRGEIVLRCIKPYRGQRGPSGEWIEHLGLIEHLQHGAGAWLAMRSLSDPDLRVRRAAVRAFVACADDASIASVLQGRVRGTTWEERFGPLEGLPAVCAVAATMPPPRLERAAKMRAILETRAVDPCRQVLFRLRQLGPDAAELLPAVEALAPIPALRFEVLRTARILRGEAPREALPDGTGR